MRRATGQISRWGERKHKAKGYEGFQCNYFQKRVVKQKLDGVGPVDNRPSTDKLYHFFIKNKKCNM